MAKKLGLYIHVPFCDGKCPYCDFYSVAPAGDICARYAEAAARELARRAAALEGTAVDTIYFGGGTPPLLGAERIASLLDTARECFAVAPDAEITVEVNPRNVTPELMESLMKAGANRISMGAQSGVQSELDALGRRHSPEDVRRAAEIIRRAGIKNLSLDIMLCFPGQTEETLRRSFDLLLSCEPEHISAYLFKLETGTPMFARLGGMDWQDEEEAARLYFTACELADEAGMRQYEISNFAFGGFESRHNLKYWNAEEYVGIGPAAHSFCGGRRGYYERSVEAFVRQSESGGARLVDDGAGGDPEEYVMLRLRLADGLDRGAWRERFGEEMPQALFDRAAPLTRAGLVEMTANGFRLTRDGFMVSNAVIGRIIG